MMKISKMDEILKNKYKTTIPDIQVGSTVKIVMRLKEKTKDKNKDKTQTVQGLIISKKHGKEMGGHFTVRRILDGIGTEWTIPMYSGNIISFEVIKAAKVKRAKLYYIREKSVRETKSALKKEYRTKNIKTETTPVEEPQEETEKVVEEAKAE